MGIGAAGVSLTFTGYASADGTGRYLVRGANGVADAVVDAGYDVLHELRGNVLIVEAPSDADLKSISGVHDSLLDFTFEMESPAAMETTQDVPAFYENQWDKHLQDVIDAHDMATGEGTRLVVIDTGIDDTHPDLGNVNVEESVSIIEGEIGDHDGDSGDHGTHVAGTAAATGEIAVIGTAPDAELVSIRVFDEEGGATFGDILLAANYAADIDADAANMSIGTAPIPPEGNVAGYRMMMQPVFNGATKEGTLFVGSAGNSAANLQQGGFFTLPNSLQGVLSTSATAPNDELAFFSNYGTNEIDAGGPGGGYETNLKTLFGIIEWTLAGSPPLRSLHPLEEGDEGELWFDENGEITFDQDEVEEVIEFESPAWPYPFNLVFSTVPKDEGVEYAWKAGTSMAAPQVTGLVGLVRELNPDANAKQVESAIKQGADGANGRSDPALGAGRVNALNTLEALAGGGGGGQGNGGNGPGNGNSGNGN